jgi:hypothetical protein
VIGNTLLTSSDYSTSQLSKVEAEKIATGKLEDQCVQECVFLSEFAAPEVSSVEGSLWISDCVSKGDLPSAESFVLASE